jgi:hypothetical protein
MISPVVARTHALREIGDSTGSMSETEDDGHVPIRRLVKAVWKRCQALLPAETRMLFWANETSEPTLDNLDSIEVRRIPAGCFAETTVKGELARARATALLRLAKFTSGENRRGVKLAAERPLEIRRKAPGLWQFSLRLTEMDDASAVPIPRARKVRVVRHEPTTYAAFVCRGRPFERVMQDAQLVIMDALARSPWFACGAPVIRFFAPNAILPFMGSFELAIPVAAQEPVVTDGAFPHGTGRGPVNRPASQPGPAVH